MKVARSTMITATVTAAAALTATGITYASAASSPTAAPQTPTVAAQAPATTTPQTAPATTAPFGGNAEQGKGNEGKGNEGRGDEGRGGEGRGGEEHREEGRILINERSYSTHPGDCITVVSGLGAKTLNIRNDSRKSVEVFRGAVCDNGAPVAFVGPHSSSFGVHPGCIDTIDVEHGVVGSFRVIRHHEDD